MVRLAFGHCGCDVDGELFQQVLDAAVLEHGILVECEGFLRAGPIPLSSNYQWELHKSREIAPPAWPVSTSEFLTSRTRKCKRIQARQISLGSPDLALSLAGSVAI